MSLLSHIIDYFRSTKIYHVQVDNFGNDRGHENIRADFIGKLSLNNMVFAREQFFWSEDRSNMYGLHIHAKTEAESKSIAVARIRAHISKRIEEENTALRERLRLLDSGAPMTTQLMRDSHGGIIPVVERFPSQEGAPTISGQIVYCTEESNLGYYLYYEGEWQECQLTAQPIKRLDHIEFECIVVDSSPSSRHMMVHKC